MPNIGGTEILLILLVVLLLFGAKRLPELSRSVGRSMRILKSETKALHDEPKASTAPTTEADGIEADAAPRREAADVAARRDAAAGS